MSLRIATGGVAPLPGARMGPRYDSAVRRRRQRGLARLPGESPRRAAGLAAVAVVGAGGIVALLRWDGKRFVLDEVAPGFTAQEVIALTEMELVAAPNVGTMA